MQAIFTSIVEQILYTLLAKKLGVIVKHDVSISDLNLGQYTHRVMTDHGIKTVKDAILSYALKHSLKGLGEKSWDAFLEAVTDKK